MSGRRAQPSTRPAKAAEAGSPKVTIAITGGIPSCCLLTQSAAASGSAAPASDQITPRTSQSSVACR